MQEARRIRAQGPESYYYERAPHEEGSKMGGGGTTTKTKPKTYMQFPDINEPILEMTRLRWRQQHPALSRLNWWRGPPWLPRLERLVTTRNGMMRWN